MKHGMKRFVGVALTALIALACVAALPLGMEAVMRGTTGLTGAFAEEDVAGAPVSTPAPVYSTPTRMPEHIMIGSTPSLTPSPTQSPQGESDAQALNPLESRLFGVMNADELAMFFFGLSEAEAENLSEYRDQDGIVVLVKAQAHDPATLRLYAELAANLERSTIFVPGDATLDRIVNESCRDVCFAADGAARTILDYTYGDLYAMKPYLTAEEQFLTQDEAARAGSALYNAMQTYDDENAVADSVSVAEAFLRARGIEPMVYNVVPFALPPDARLCLAGGHVYALSASTGEAFAVTVDLTGDGRVVGVSTGDAAPEDIERALRGATDEPRLDEPPIPIEQDDSMYGKAMALLSALGVPGDQDRHPYSVQLSAAHLPARITRGALTELTKVVLARQDRAAALLDSAAESRFTYTLYLTRAGRPFMLDSVLELGQVEQMSIEEFTLTGDPEDSPLLQGSGADELKHDRVPHDWPAEVVGAIEEAYASFDQNPARQMGDVVLLRLQAALPDVTFEGSGETELTVYAVRSLQTDEITYCDLRVICPFTWFDGAEAKPGRAHYDWINQRFMYLELGA